MKEIFHGNTPPYFMAMEENLLTLFYCIISISFFAFKSFVL